MNIVKCRLSKCISSIVLILIVASSPIIACDWDYLIWSIHTKDADPLYRFIQNGKAGYIDQTGKIVIEAKFKFDGNYGGEFHDGLMTSIQLDDYYDAQGRLVRNRHSSFRYGQFSEGLAIATQDDGKNWGYVDRAGLFVISPQFKSSLHDYVSPFFDGLAAIAVNDRWGYINRTGEFVVSPRFAEGSDFQEGIARVVTDGPCKYFVDGPCPESVSIPLFNTENNLPNCKYSFIDKTGTLISSEKFDDARHFSEGLAAVRIGDKWGFIDKTGRFAIEPKFSGAWEFSDGLAKVRQGKLIGYINHNGDFEISPQFQTADNFSDGRALIGYFDIERREWRKYYYIDKTGKEAFPERYVVASSFYKGLAHVLLEKAKEPKLVEQVWAGTYGYIDVNGKVIFKYEVK